MKMGRVVCIKVRLYDWDTAWGFAGSWPAAVHVHVQVCVLRFPNE